MSGSAPNSDKESAVAGKAPVVAGEALAVDEPSGSGASGVSYDLRPDVGCLMLVNVHMETGAAPRDACQDLVLSPGSVICGQGLPVEVIEGLRQPPVISGDTPETWGRQAANFVVVHSGSLAIAGRASICRKVTLCTDGRWKTRLNLTTIHWLSATVQLVKPFCNMSNVGVATFSISDEVTTLDPEMVEFFASKVVEDEIRVLAGCTSTLAGPLLGALRGKGIGCNIAGWGPCRSNEDDRYSVHPTYIFIIGSVQGVVPLSYRAPSDAPRFDGRCARPLAELKPPQIHPDLRGGGVEAGMATWGYLRQPIVPPTSFMPLAPWPKQKATRVALPHVFKLMVSWGEKSHRSDQAVNGRLDRMRNRVRNNFGKKPWKWNKY